MKMSKLINTRITGYANATERVYRNTIQIDQEGYDDLQKWISRISDGRLNYISKIKSIKVHGRVLELGAGSAWLSSELSKLKEIKQVFCLDFSERITREIAPKVMDYLHADTKKITRVEGDFNNLEFEEGYFDFVFFDAAMHHITDMGRVLQEVRKVLKPGGRIIAIREPVIPLLCPWKRYSFGKEDRRKGITENIYTRSEWERFFRCSGFRLEFLPFLPETNYIFKLLNKWPLSLINNCLFAHYIFLAGKEKQNKGL